MSHISDFSRISQPGIPERAQGSEQPNTPGLFDSRLNALKSAAPANATDHSSMRMLASQMLATLDRASMNAIFSDLMPHNAPSVQNKLSTDLFMAMRRVGDITARNQAEATAKSAQPTATSPTTPETFAPLIEQAAAKTGLDPKLIEAVIRTESDFDPNALSPVGAQGLMQLMPETAKDLGVSDPFDPAQNVEAGSRYLKQLMDRYDGNTDKALAAYNWGMGNLDRHPERMPEETVNYVAKINNLLNSVA